MLDETGNVDHRLLWGAAVDQILADENSSGDVNWLLTDHQNTVRDIVQYDEATYTTSVVNHLAYDAFGNVTSETDPALDVFNLQYTARYFDEATGLQYNNARWYDAATGQWMSQDPISFAADDENLYRYVTNRPITLTDPSGLEPSRGYWADVGLTAKGYFWNGPSSMFTGIWDAVSDPPRTARGIQHAFTHPVETFNVIKDDYAQKLETSEGQGEVAFDVVTTLLTLGSGAGTKAASRTGKLAKTLDNSADAVNTLNRTNKAAITANAARASGLTDEIVDLSNLGKRIECPPSTTAAPTNLGRVIGQADAINPGSLADDLAKTFSGGRYSEVILDADTVLYRAGTADRPLGQFFDTAIPDGVLQSRIDKAVLPRWPGGGSSPIDSVIGFRIPKGTRVFVGEVSTQGGIYVGGTPQIVVVKPWTIDGVEVINVNPLR